MIGRGEIDRPGNSKAKAFEDAERARRALITTGTRLSEEFVRGYTAGDNQLPVEQHPDYLADQAALAEAEERLDRLADPAQ